MNTNEETTSASNSLFAVFRRRLGRAPLPLLALLALSLTVPVREASAQSVTLPATEVTSSSATLNGTISQDLGWLVQFEWGAVPGYDHWTSLTNIGPGTNVVPVSAPLVGLTPNTTYHFRVHAYHGGYSYSVGSDLSFTTLGPPRFSTMPATDVSSDSATLNGAVHPNGSPTTAWFQWGNTTNYGNLTSVTPLGGGTNTLPLSGPLAGLIPNVTYHFRIAATNDYGLAYGSDQSFTTLGLPQVSTLPATGASAQSATLNGAVNPNGWPTTAWFQWGATTNYGNLTSVTALGSGTTALPLSAPLAGLTLDVTYHFRVGATNHYGATYGTDQSFTPLGRPQVTTLPATGLSTTGATLNGTVNPDGWPTSAWFQWGATTNYGNLTSTNVLGNGTIVLPLSAPLAGLTPNVTYHFRVAATNDYGLVYGSDQSLTSASLPTDFTYTISNDSITITGYTGRGGAVTIPGTIDGYPVTAIGNSAFYGCTNLTSLTILEGVTSIGIYAFEGCAGLTSMTIPDSATSIGEAAFYECANLTNLTIGTNVTSIGESAFEGCASLTNVTIPDSVASLGRGAFGGCTSLTSITIPNSVTSVGDGAFGGCVSLTSVTIGANLTDIGAGAFFSCSNLTGVYFLGNAPSLGRWDVFYGDSNATVYNLPGTTGWGATFGGRYTALWQPPAPEAWTLSASAIPPTAATLNGMVNPNGWPTTAWFQWGATTNYGNLTSTTNLGSGTTVSPFSAPLAGLTPGVTYHFRVAARNDYYGLAYGSDQSFTPESLEAPLILTSGPGFGVQSNAFGFIISGATNLPVVVEACTNLANHSWSPVQTNALTGGWSYFSDPQWANYPVRFYRLQHP